jgi:hypothetical protein
MASADSHENLPFGWQRSVDQHGRSYYINHSRGTTQWGLPGPARDEQLPPGWVRSVDHCGVGYYTNHDTRVTQWACPVPADAAHDAPPVPAGTKRPYDELGRQQTVAAAEVIHAEAVALRALLGTRVYNLQVGLVALSDAECDDLDQLCDQWQRKLADVRSMLGDQSTSPGDGA